MDLLAAARLDSGRACDRYERAARGVGRRGEFQRAPAHELGLLADAFAIDVEALYGEAFERALREGYETREQSSQGRFVHRTLPKQLVVGNRGYDFTVTLPKSNSVLMAYADAAFAAEYEELVDEIVHEGATLLESWTAYAMRGHHGRRSRWDDPNSGQRVQTSGMLGWVTVHRAARPVGDAPVGDPHWHAHFSIANMVRGRDGRWSTVAAGGRDIYRHAKAVDAFVQARLRHEAHARYGITFAKSASRVWEINGIPAATIALFSKRDAQIRELFTRLHLSYDDASLRARKAASARTRQAKPVASLDATHDVLRAYWQDEGRRELDDDPAVITAKARHESELNTEREPDVVMVPTVEEIAAIVFDPDDGLTAHDKRFSWPAAYAAVLDTLPCGIASSQAADELVARVLDHAGYAVRLPQRGPTHFQHPDRYTTQDVLHAERTVLSQACERFGTDTAVVSKRTARMALAAFEADRGFSLTEEQRVAYQRIVRGGHGVEAVLGVAGSGKTTLMAAVRRAYQAAGLTIEGASTAAIAVDNLRRNAGLESRTIASYLTSIEENLRGLHGLDVLIVDEAAMADDRDMAKLLVHAACTGTKVVAIGDPAQLQSPGIGGTFAAVHRIVEGITLSENRRQRDELERAAVALLRDKGESMPPALGMLAEHGRVHAARTRDDAVAALLVHWSRTRGEFVDSHDLIEAIVVLAATNANVETINTAARALRRDAGELDVREVTYQLPDGHTLTFSVGDIVAVRRNAYLSQEGLEANDVLNGYRGVIVGIDDERRVTIEWRERDDTGATRLLRETLTPEFVASGGLSHGIAITAHRSQGLSAQVSLVFGNGMFSNALYEAMTRGRNENHLWLSLDAYETDDDAARLGSPQGPDDLQARVINAFIAQRLHDQDEDLVLTELDPRLREQLSPLSVTADTTVSPNASMAVIDQHVNDVLGEELARRACADSAWPTLRRKLHSVCAMGQDVRDLLTTVACDPTLPPLAQATSVAKVLAWRVDRHQEARLTNGGQTTTDTRPVDDVQPLLDALLGRVGDEAVGPTREVSLDDLAAGIVQADLRAGDAARLAQVAQDTEAALAAALRSDNGPAVRRVRAQYASIVHRGQALEEMTTIAQHVRPLREELDQLRQTLSECGGTPEEAAARTRMRQLREELTRHAGRWLSLDQIVGEKKGRDTLLRRWREVREGHSQALAEARARDTEAVAHAQDVAATSIAKAREAASHLKSLLDTYQARTAKPDADQPPPAASTPWQHRPYGRLTDEDLARRLRSARRQTDIAEAKAHHAMRRAADLRAAVNNQRGPAVEAVHAGRDRLQDRMRQRDKLRAAEQRIQDLGSRITAVETELTNLQDRLTAVGRFARPTLRGYQRDLATRRVEELRGQLLDLVTQRNADDLAAAMRRSQLPDNAGEDLLREWEHEQQTWSTRLSAARTADAEDATHAERIATQRRTEADAIHTTAYDLAAEQQLRASLPADVAERETAEREALAESDSHMSGSSIDTLISYDADAASVDVEPEEGIDQGL